MHPGTRSDEKNYGVGGKGRLKEEKSTKVRWQIEKLPERLPLARLERWRRSTAQQMEGGYSVGW